MFFLASFFDVFLEGLRAQFWEDFGMILGMILAVFLKKCVARGHAKNIVSIWYLLWFRHIGLFKKSWNMNK